MPNAVKDFRLVKKELAKDKKKENVIGWNDIFLSSNRDTDQYSESSYDLPQVQKKWTLDNNKGEEFDPQNPIQSFREMLTNNKMDLVEKALNEMSSYIDKRTSFAQSASDWD